MLQKCGIIGHWVSHESLGRLCDVDAMAINATAVDTFKIHISTKALSKIEMPFTRFLNISRYWAMSSKYSKLGLLEILLRYILQE